MLRIFIALESPSPSPGFKPSNLGSTLTITPQRTSKIIHCPYIPQCE
jgi:hypothetical protein